MKTLFFSTFCVVLSALFVQSCSDSTDLGGSLVSENQPIEIRTNDNPKYHYYDNGLPDGDPNLSYGCTTPAINCAAEVSGPTCVGTIFDNLGSWTAVQFQNFVNSNSADIAATIGSGETSGLISGTYNLRLRGTASDGYLIVRSGTTIVSVTPVY